VKWRAVLAVLAILGFSNFAPVAGFRHGRSDLEAQIEAFVADYNHLRYHESIANLTPADVYFGRGQTIQIERERIKRQTIANRRFAAPSASRITLQTRGARDSLNLSRSLSQKL
jgi:hypothetical protein